MSRGQNTMGGGGAPWVEGPNTMDKGVKMPWFDIPWVGCPIYHG